PDSRTRRRNARSRAGRATGNVLRFFSMHTLRPVYRRGRWGVAEKEQPPRTPRAPRKTPRDQRVPEPGSPWRSWRSWRLPLARCASCREQRGEGIGVAAELGVDAGQARGRGARAGLEVGDLAVGVLGAEEVAAGDQDVAEVL